MNILIVAATPQEVSPTRQYLAEKIYQRRKRNVDILITGVGLVNTTYNLSKYFSVNKPDLVIQSGIAGSFHPFYPPGMVTVVTEEVFGDLGVKENNEFKDIFDLSLAESGFPFSNKLLINPHKPFCNKAKLRLVRD